MSPHGCLLLSGTRHRPRGARRMADSFLASEPGADLRVYVADARDPDGPAFSHPDARVRVVGEEPRLGMSAGLNRLFFLAALELGDEMPRYVCWGNDDCEFEPGFVGAAITALERNPEAGLAALPYLVPHPPPAWHVNTFPDPGLPYANFGLLSTSLFARVRGFDERVLFRGCDNALTFKVYADGLGVLPVPHPCIVHHYENDPVREANEGWDTRAGWDVAWREHRDRVPEYRAVQARVRVEGFVPKSIFLVTRGDGRTYAQRFGRVVGNAVPADIDVQMRELFPEVYVPPTTAAGAVRPA